jgi:drug/metabolite transporter (DMT)-like permease
MSRNNRTVSDDRRNDDVDRDPDRRDERADHGANPSESGKWISALIALLGLWMAVQAIGVELTAAQFWNDILVGALLIGVGGYNYSQRASERFGNTAVALIAVAAGLWLIAAPFVLGADTGFTETTNVFGFYNDLVVGLLAVILGAYSAYKARDHQEDTRRTTT